MIKIDMRETELIKEIENLIKTQDNFKDMKIQVENLPLGDIIIGNELIIERKTLNDLAASIKDGRYDEQSFRLNGLPNHNHNIIYLIEGDLCNINTLKLRLDKSTLYSAMFSIAFYKGFSLLRSRDISESAYILCNMVYKLEKTKDRPLFYSNEDKMNKTDKTYCEVIKKVKKENITKDNIGQIMLCQIPGISSQTSKAILQKFGSLPKLIQNINEDEKCMDDIYTVDTNNKSRKINKTCIQNILAFLK
jgi:ERCC4-type nuclease